MGEVESLLSAAEERHQKRQATAGWPHDAVVEAVDLDSDSERTQRMDSSMRPMLALMVLWMMSWPLSTIVSSVLQSVLDRAAHVVGPVDSSAHQVVQRTLTREFYFIVDK